MPILSLISPSECGKRSNCPLVVRRDTSTKSNNVYASTIFVQARQVGGSPIFGVGNSHFLTVFGLLCMIKVG
jgi:hypothetical protein